MTGQGLTRAVDIQRRLPPSEWAHALDALPQDEQPDAREYLRGIWIRMKAQRAVKDSLAVAARSSDPVTSYEAAQRVNACGSRDAHVGQVVQAVQAHPGHTSAELARTTGLERHEVARRTADAEHLGRIRKGTPKVCDVSGKRAVTWWPVPSASQWACLYGDAA